MQVNWMIIYLFEARLFWVLQEGRLSAPLRHPDDPQPPNLCIKGLTPRYYR